MRRTAPAFLVAAMLLAACGRDDPSVVAEQRGRPVVVASFWPLAEAAMRIGGDRIVVVNLTPVGESPHELDITPRQRDEVRDADLALVLGRGFQRDVEREAARRDGPTVDVLAQLDLPERPDGGAGPPDPHVWLDPTIMGSIVSVVADAVADLLPDEADDVRDRAEEVVEEHVALDARFAQSLARCERSLIASQHEAFGWLAARYGLRTVAFDGTDPDDDPAPEPSRLDAIEPALEDGSVATLFTETLSPGSWLEVVAEEHGLDTAVLNPYEGLTTREDATGATYGSVLRYDLRVLVDHLDCTVDDED